MPAAPNAGAIPNISPVTTVSAKVKARTGRSIAIAGNRSSTSGFHSFNPVTASQASAMPASPPGIASTRLSTRACPTTCPRVAPSARRTASSRRRIAARANRRLARFAHAISSTSPTAPLRTRSAGRRSPVMRRCSGVATMSMPLRKPPLSNSLGYSARIAAVTWGICACNCSSVSGALSRARIFTKRMGRIRERGRWLASSTCIGRQIFVPFG